MDHIVIRILPTFLVICNTKTMIIIFLFLFSWYDREHIPINMAFDNQTFNQIIFAADDETATTTTYAVAPWTKGPFLGVDPPQKIVRYRIFDFYRMKNGMIW